MRNFNDYFPEQDETFDKEAWAKEKQAARDGVYKLAADTAVGICKSGKKYRSYLDVQAVFPGKSVNNALLILAQNKDARQIGTRDFWRDQGLYVKREEMQNAIRILEANGTYDREDGTTGTSVDVFKVYDISQTNARARVQKPVAYDDRVLMNALIYNRPVQIISVDELPDNAGALYDHEQTAIFIKRGLPADELFCALSKELAHAEIAAVDPEYTREGADFKARSVSYMLGKQYGRDVSGYTFTDIPEVLRDGDPQLIRDELADTREVASLISARMSRSLNRDKTPRSQEKER